jgi:glycosyltransferase involved in cell wall biosynthesis
MSDWYNRAQIYVLSSRYEGFPNTLIEAMSHGIPVVSFACETGPQEIIRHEDNGVLVTTTSQAKGLARALANLMSDSAVRKHYASTAIEVRERFSIEKISSDWEAVLSLGEHINP